MTAFIDVNVYLSRWPERRLPYDETADLVTYLKHKKVKQAWVGSFDGLLHKDISAVNQRLFVECQQHGPDMLIPFGSINPAYSGWEEDLEQCAQKFRMPGIRLHPNYHGYSFADSRCTALFKLAAEHKLIVQVALKMEDERTQPRLLSVPTVEVAPLVALAKSFPHVNIIVLNSLRTLRGALLEPVAQQENMLVEISMLEGAAGITKLLKSMPMNRILFGSYFPFYYWQSAELKLQESDLGEYQRNQIRSHNAAVIMSTPQY